MVQMPIAKVTAFLTLSMGLEHMGIWEKCYRPISRNLTLIWHGGATSYFKLVIFTPPPPILPYYTVFTAVKLRFVSFCELHLQTGENGLALPISCRVSNRRLFSPCRIALLRGDAMNSARKLNANRKNRQTG
jgi:hypothetical protein